jgi:hypothetical protein
MKNAFIYALNDPTTGRTCYVGKTKHKNLLIRLNQHLRGSKNYTHTCADWIKSLQAKGLKPTIEELAMMPEGDWPAWERAYIQLYKMMGFNLLNDVDGGAGMSNPRPETRAKLSAHMMGNTHTLGYRHLPEARSKMSAAMVGNTKRLGKHPSPETRAKLSAAHTGRHHTAETIAKIRLAIKLKWGTPEFRAVYKKHLVDA